MRDSGPDWLNPSKNELEPKEYSVADSLPDFLFTDSLGMRG